MCQKVVSPTGSAPAPQIALDSLQAEYDKLQAPRTELAGQIAAAREELQPMKDIRCRGVKVLTPEQKIPQQKKQNTEDGTVRRLPFSAFEDDRCFLFLWKLKMHPAIYRVHFQFPDKPLCVPIRANVNTSRSFSIL